MFKAVIFLLFDLFFVDC